MDPPAIQNDLAYGLISPVGDADWEPFKETIIQLYWTENRSVDEVMKIMKDRHGFDASKKRYKRQFIQWSLEKNLSRDKLASIVKIQDKRRKFDRKETEFTLWGKPLAQEKIKRGIKRHKLEAEDSSSSNDDASVSTPAGIEYSTPAPSAPTPTAPAVEDSTQSDTSETTSRPPVLLGLDDVSRPSLPASESGFPVLENSPNGVGDLNQYALSTPIVAAQHLGSVAPQGNSSQVFQSTGKRRALLIGINYFGQRGQIRGAVNDARNMSAYLTQNFGYQSEDMVILTDDPQNPMNQPTKDNILKALHWLVKDAMSNDLLFFYYSGHSGQVKDVDGSSDDGYEEVIYPVDFQQVGHITDDEMHTIMVKPLPSGVKLTALLDSYHSGIGLDLPYIYSTQGILKEPNLVKEADHGLFGIISAFSMVSSFVRRATGGEKDRTKKTSPADVVVFSTRTNYQERADTGKGYEENGALSWAFRACLKKNDQKSYVQLLDDLREMLQTRFTQRPQISCNHPLGIIHVPTAEVEYRALTNCVADTSLLFVI